jgi:hypothetical protein
VYRYNRDESYMSKYGERKRFVTIEIVLRSERNVFVKANCYLFIQLKRRKTRCFLMIFWLLQDKTDVLFIFIKITTSKSRSIWIKYSLWIHRSLKLVWFALQSLFTSQRILHRICFLSIVIYLRPMLVYKNRRKPIMLLLK